MKKNILTKLLALVLAIVMVLGTCFSALAEVSEATYQSILLETATELYNQYMSSQDYRDGVEIEMIFEGNQRDAFLNLMGEEAKEAFLALEAMLYEEYLLEHTPPVNYDNVAKFPAISSTIVTRGFYTTNKAEDNDKLVLSKVVTPLEEGKFQIELEAYTTGTVSVVTSSKPCDIILVVDMSTSMESDFSDYTAVYELDKSQTYYTYERGLFGGSYEEISWCSTHNAWCQEGWGSHTQVTPKTSSSSSGEQFYTGAQDRLSALKNAATTFISNVADQENNTMAIVGFHSSSVSLTNGFLDVDSNEQTLKNAINGIDSGDLKAATDHDDGLVAAEALFAAQNTSGDHQRVVVMITDGEPEPLNSGNWSASTVKNAITSAYNLKNTYKAALYTVSVMPGTDASNPTTNMDKYMNYMSSNYPSAQYTGTYTGTNEASIINAITHGTRADTDGASFYLTASDVATLNSIFEQITTQTGGSSVQLGSNTEIRDIVTPYFELPAAGEVTVQTYDCTGYTNDEPTWSTEATTLNSADVVDVTGNNVTVTGFDFNHNFVSATGRVEGDTSQSGDFHGRKIKITFVTEPKDEFWGGNNVPTNGDTSGVYAAGAETATGLFDVPHVNVPLNVPDMTGNNVNIYLKSTEEIGVDELSNAEAFVVDPNAEWKTKFVVITPPSFVNSNQTISNTQDTENIEMQVVVAAKETANATSVGTPVTQPVTKTAQGNVYVFKPVLTFKDTVEEYLKDVTTGTVADYHNASNYESEVWVHTAENGVETSVQVTTGENGTTTTTPTMTGSKPTLTLAYDTAETEINANGVVLATEDIPVTVTVAIGDEDVTGHTTFKHTACGEGVSCGWNEVTLDGDPAFIVHVINVVGDLTITKTGLDFMTYEESSDPVYSDNESAVFTVVGDFDGDGQDETFTVIIPCKNGSGSKTLTGLRVGEYTVTELTNWTWRYDTTTYVVGSGDMQSGNEGDVEVEGGKTATITFNNSDHDAQWLGGDNYAVNTFSK